MSILPPSAAPLLLAAATLALGACRGPVFEDPPSRFNTEYGQGAYARPQVYDAPLAAPGYAGDPQSPVTATDVVPPRQRLNPPVDSSSERRPPLTSLPPPPPVSAAPSRAYLTGRPVPGKPGYVISPYSPNAGYVDVKGFNSGEQVKDPYSGKIFLVP